MIPHSRPWLSEDDARAVAEVVRSGQIAGGLEVQRFESELAARVGRSHAVAVSSGTAALSLALRALDDEGVGPGDEVVIPSYVCSSLYHAVLNTQAKPVLADCAPGAFTLSAATIEPRLGSATKAIIVPHLFGISAPIEEIEGLGLPVLEDCAMALGATLRGRPLGSFGAASVFSFYATKLLATGEGGMVATDDAALAERVRQLRSYDASETLSPRFNYKLTDLHAALGRSQLRRFANFVARRQAIAQRYQQAFTEFDAELPSVPNESTSCWYRYVLRCRTTLEPILEEAAAAGVTCERPVYRPLHQYLGLPDADYPETAAVHAAALSVPCYPALTDAEVDQVIEVVRASLPPRGHSPEVGRRSFSGKER